MEPVDSSLTPTSNAQIFASDAPGCPPLHNTPSSNVRVPQPVRIVFGYRGKSHSVILGHGSSVQDLAIQLSMAFQLRNGPASIIGIHDSFSAIMPLVMCYSHPETLTERVYQLKVDERRFDDDQDDRKGCGCFGGKRNKPMVGVVVEPAMSIVTRQFTGMIFTADSTVTHVNMADLLASANRQQRLNAIQRMCTALAADGYFMLRVNKDVTDAMKQLHTECLPYFARSLEDKKRFHTFVEERKFAGYAAESVREFFQCRLLGDGNERIYPPDLPLTFQQTAVDVYKQFEHLTRVCLEAIADYIKCPHQFVTGLLDPAELQPGEFSSSLYRYYKYTEVVDDRKMPCGIHADMGLLTAAPAASQPGLIIQRNSDMKQIQVTGDEDELLLYGGEQLARLTCGLFRPVLHQVVPTFAEPRYSLPFFQRARPMAVIDCGAMVAAGAQLPRDDPELLQPTTIQDMMYKYVFRRPWRLCPRTADW